MKELLYGAAYYDEYMPYDRLDKDVEMMKKFSGGYSGIRRRADGPEPYRFPWP